MARRCVAALVLLLTAGCAAGPVDPEHTAPTREVRPAGVRDPAPAPTAVAELTCGDPRVSLRPDGALPPPGRMPAGSTMERIVRRGFLVAGVNQNAYQVGHRDAESGDLVGFEIDLVRELARALFGDPDRVRYRSIPAADRVSMIQRGEVDVVVRTMTITCADRAEVAFSTEYFTARQRLLVRRGSPPTEIEDLTGRKVCAAAGSTSLTNIATFSPRAVPVSTRDVIDCLVLLQQHQVDAISTSDVLLAALAAQDPNTVLAGRPLKEQPYGVAIARTAPDLVRFVNGVLARIRADGTWTRSYTRWLSPYLGPAPPPPPARYPD